MQKLLAGCGCLAILLIVPLAIGGYFFVYQPVREMVDYTREAVAELEAMSALDEQVENDGPFDPPKDGVLSEEQVVRFVAVQRAIIAAVGDRGESLEQGYGALHRGDASEPGQSFKPREMLIAFRDIANLARDVKQDQVEALNAQGFSLDEYGWVKTTFFEAYGVGIISVNPGALPDFDELRKWFESGDFTIDLESFAGGVRDSDAEAPAPNRALVEPYREEVPRWIPYASLGL